MGNPQWPTDTRDFDKALLDALDEVLLTLGEQSKKIIYFHLQNKYLLKKEDIPRKPVYFALAVRGMLGMSGSFIETQVLKNLCKKLGLQYENLKNHQFEAAIEEIRREVNNQSSVL